MAGIACLPDMRERVKKKWRKIVRWRVLYRWIRVIEANVPVVVQFSRQDTRQAENAIFSTMAFAADEYRVRE